jgi:hypothetical protein
MYPVSLSSMERLLKSLFWPVSNLSFATVDFSGLPRHMISHVFLTSGLCSLCPSLQRASYCTCSAICT